jgi:pSer/pThr/pTyr-binding forkhead associated (FHA) protein
VQTFVLDASMYSIGRDPTNAIVVHSDSVSRQHAILLRIPNPDKTYRYAIQDGNLEGKPSANGIIVNGVTCKKHILEDGDEIVIGGKATLLYRTPILSDAELEEKVTHPEYRRSNYP